MKQYTGHIIIAAAIIVAAIIYAFATRYVNSPGGRVLDHWTGKKF